MSEKRFGYGETVLFEWVEEDGEIISTKECVQKLNEQQDTIGEQKIAIDELITDYKKLEKENEQLKEKNERLQWELDNLNYFVNLKVSAMRGSDCGHDRCYVTSMQKKGDGV